jgi:thiosulfate/3-mercaptopyruvate sulfurtransferase
MNGGRKKWLIEDRLVNKDIPQYSQGHFKASDADNSIRVFLNNVKDSFEKVRKDTAALVDVRSPKEFTGEILAPLEYPLEHAQRGGHIPGAKNIPWSDSVNYNDGTFKSTDELKELYESKGVTPDKEVIAYC